MADIAKLTAKAIALFPNRNVYRVSFGLSRFQASGLEPWSVHVKVDTYNLMGVGPTPDSAIDALQNEPFFANLSK